tara:strand:+ start:297 stop:941 length:645 start_codon:yes stop_codon:yes gene_type:complete
MKKIIFIFLIITSCSVFEEPNPSEAYYNFENEDLDKLLILELNDIVKYKNQYGEEIIYEAINVSDEFRTQRTRGNWVTSSIAKLFFYDKKDIELKNSAMNSSIDYRFTRYPVNDIEAEKNKNFKYASKFYARVYFDFWNGISDYREIYINYKSQKVSLMINGVNYKNVIIIESKNDKPNYNSTIERSANVVYYDTDFGIIGFDDLLNNEWRIID